MHRQTPVNTAFLSYTSGGARAVVRDVDDTKEMQEAHADFLNEESQDKIEAPQNYGFTSVTMDCDKGQQQSTGSSGGQKKKFDDLQDGPESFVTFVGGNRSFPVIYPIDDRRHRLRNLSKGDVAIYRTAKDRQQLHMVKSDDGKYVGTYLSTREDMMWRFALVPKPKDDQQQQGDQQGKRGQNNCLEDNVKSAVCFEETKDHHLLQHNKNTLEQKDVNTNINYDQAHIVIDDDQIICYLKDDVKISMNVAADHVHILYKKFAMWVNKGGCFASVRPVIAQDPDV
jgi:Bacteriophage Mu Gp45 spike protein